ncbi:proteasome assembly chaperone family protein [Halobacteriales archaeon QS_3_64_16]|nr:MAG: proteasome assembly chaperone family protein [Halobacteriales archaeon QS_3_64_16]
MDEFDIETVAEDDLDEPVLIEGLPGVGHVGKLAVEHLLEEYDSELLKRVYSEHFPPQVTVEDGRTKLACLEFHAVQPENGEDLLVLTGDHQAQDAAGHYRLAETVLDIADSTGVARLFALGGVPTGELVDDHAVIGAATSEDVLTELEEVGVEFREDEPAGGIVGVSGLLLGLGERRGFEGACLMGETSGYLVDPKSAQAVLEVLQEAIGFSVSFESLEDRAEEMEEVVRQIQELEGGMSAPSDDDLRYIG